MPTISKRVCKKVDTPLLTKVFLSSQFPISIPQAHYYGQIEQFVRDDELCTKLMPGLYEVGLGVAQLHFIHELMQSFELEEFDKLKPSRILIQKTGLGSADRTSYQHNTAPDNCVRFVLNYREDESNKPVGIKVNLGPGGVVYFNRPFATVLQRNFSSMNISSGKELVGTRRETARSYFVIADMYAPAMLIMRIVNNTAGANEYDFEGAMKKPHVKKIIENVLATADKGEMSMDSAMEMVMKILQQQKSGPTHAATEEKADVEDI